MFSGGADSKTHPWPIEKVKPQSKILEEVKCSFDYRKGLTDLECDLDRRTGLITDQHHSSPRTPSSWHHHKLLPAVIPICHKPQHCRTKLLRLLNVQPVTRSGEEHIATIWNLLSNIQTPLGGENAATASHAVQKRDPDPGQQRPPVELRVICHEEGQCLAAAAERFCMQQGSGLVGDGETAAAVHVPSRNVCDVSTASGLEVGQGGRVVAAVGAQLPVVGAILLGSLGVERGGACWG